MAGFAYSIIGHILVESGRTLSEAGGDVVVGIRSIRLAAQAVFSGESVAGLALRMAKCAPIVIGGVLVVAVWASS